MLGKYKAAYGATIVFDDFSAKETFAILNQITPDVDGVSEKDLSIAHAVLIDAIAEEI